MPCPHPVGPAGHLEALRRELGGRGWITSVLRASDLNPQFFE